ncbi:glutamyl-tRNA(Gln) and/or aspartyl-tRNA(Asn) amidotransferase, A subunit [gamma proteobacterium HIMB55]|nr:glutamyl-tRNA(Gln) and/or aspartyl-tRNA(Asn) amidotransferase, A subunit [gamma proteobacterium HIMB55]
MTTSFETVAGLRSKLATGDVSSVELTRDALTRISDLNPELNAVISSSEERAINAAKKADEARQKGEENPLLGIPLLHKDIFCTQGLPTTCASKMLADFVAPYDATVVRRLDQAGMVTLGKCNMDEFAMGSSNETSHFGACKNPWDTSRVPGGSSGGSASAVAAGLVSLATGTDTGGSIRQPAALCGITGLKPTYGRVSRYGMIAFASSMDQAGPMARTAEDCALVLEAMAGADPLDSTCADQPVPRYSSHLTDTIEGMRVGVPKEFFSSDLNSDVAAAIEASLAELEGMGAKLVEVSLPSTSLGVSTYYIIAPAEASANLSRYDGVRYGYRCDNPTDLQDLYLRSRSEGFGDEVKRRILVGAFTLSAASYDQYFMKAQQVRRLIAQEYEDVLSQVDVIAGPSAPNTAFVLNDTSKSITDMYMEDVFTIGANLAGLPAMSVPAGLVDGLPVGMQLIGRRFGEVDILKLAHQFQQQTTWHSLTPTMEDRH